MDSGDFGDCSSYDAFKRTCMSHTVLEVLASKWVYLVVCALRRTTLRHGELARKVEGITPKMLTQTLRELERDGLVNSSDSATDCCTISAATLPFCWIRSGRGRNRMRRRSATRVPGRWLAQARWRHFSLSAQRATRASCHPWGRQPIIAPRLLSTSRGL